MFHLQFWEVPTQHTVKLLILHLRQSLSWSRRTGLRIWDSICCCQRHAPALSVFARLTGMYHGAAPIFSLCLSDDLLKHDSTFVPFLKLALLLKEF